LKQSIQARFKVLGAHCVFKTLLPVSIEKLLCFSTLICEFIELHSIHNSFWFINSPNSNKKMASIKVLNVNVDLMAVGFDDDGINEMALGSYEVSKLVVGSISTPSTTTPSTSNPEIETTWELLKVQLGPNQKAWIFHSKTSSP